MEKNKLRKHLPTIPAYLDKRRKAKLNQLPKHLRPLPIWPLWLQLALNCGLIITLYNMMVDRDDYVSEAGPAIGLVVCILLLIYTFISAFRLKHRHAGARGGRLATLNILSMLLAFLFWCGSILVFLS